MLSEIFINWWGGVVLPLVIIGLLVWAGVHFGRRYRRRHHQDST